MRSYSLYRIPFEGKELIYRPRRRLCFVGNTALANAAERFCRDGDETTLDEFPEVRDFFRSIGFLQPDPEPAAEWEFTRFKPAAAALLMTNRCNLRCVYCYANGGEENQKDLPLSYGKQAIDFVAKNAKERGKDHFTVTFHGGGEPTLNWETLTALSEYAREKDLPAELNTVTNGFWSAERGKELMRLLDGLTLSVDGGEITQNRQRPAPGGAPSFPVVMRSIEQLSEANFPFAFRMTVTPEGFASLAEDVAFLCDHSTAKTIQAEPAFNTERGTHQAALEAQGNAFAEAFLEAYDAAAERGVQLTYSGARPHLLTNVFCQAPVGESFTVNPLGEITGCYEMTGREGCTFGIFGKMNEEGFVIDEEKRQFFVKGILNRKKRCASCFCYDHCAGDCFTRGLPISGGEFPYARCEINRKIMLGLLLRSMSGKEPEE